MDLGKCLIMYVLRNFDFISVDRLANLVFLVDRLGNYNAFNWTRIDLIISSDEFLSLMEELKSNGVVKENNGFISIVNKNIDDALSRDCGWLSSNVKSTVSFVLSKYGSLSDSALSDVVESIFEGDEF